jgi:hypothetical protein
VRTPGVLTKSLSENTWCPTQDSNRLHPEYESSGLALDHHAPHIHYVGGSQNVWYRDTISAGQRRVWFCTLLQGLIRLYGDRRNINSLMTSLYLQCAVIRMFLYSHEKFRKLFSQTILSNLEPPPPPHTHTSIFWPSGGFAPQYDKLCIKFIMYMSPWRSAWLSRLTTLPYACYILLE